MTPAPFKAPAWLLPLLRLVLLCNLALLVWYVCFGYRHLMHSDAAVMNLLAQEILETGKYFPPEWNYVNNDLWVLFLQTLALPLVAFLPNGMAVHAAACLVACAIVLHATWMLSRVIGQSLLARTATLVIVTAGWSETMTETMFGQAAYGLLYAMAAYLFVFTVRAAQGTGRRRWCLAAVAGAILLLACWANPHRAAVQYALPLLAAGATLWLRAGRRPDASVLKLVLCLLAFSAAGTALHQWTLHFTAASQGLTQVRYLDLDGMAGNLGRTLRGLLMLFDGLPTPGSVPTTAYGVGVAARMIGALALTFLFVPWAVRRAWQTRDPILAALVAFCLSSLAIILFFMTVTSLPNPTALEGSIRYLVVPLLCLVIMLPGMAIDRAGPVRPALLALWSTLALLACSAPVAYRVADVGLFATHTPPRTRALLDYLRQNRLEYGYATYWNANKYTVLSAGAVRIRPIDLEKGVPMPKRLLSSDRWYRPQAWQGRSFLLLDEQEDTAFRPQEVASHAGPPLARLRFEHWRIYVYDHNLAMDMPGWDVAYLQPAVLIPTATTPHLTGHLEAAPAALVAERGEAGMLAFGPWLTVSRGSFVATFDIETSGTGNDFGGVDVVSAGGTVTHGAAAITRAGHQLLAVPFTLDRVVDMVELRVRSSGNGTMKLRRITLQAAKR